jgi:hypothetical protein
MTHSILLTREPNKQFIARVLSLPGVVAYGQNEQEVLAEVKALIAGIQRNSRIVEIDVPDIDGVGDPWLENAGIWADDPDWDLFQAEIKNFRDEIDQTTDA